MNKKPLVSIVSITYNQEKYVRAALDSFIEQQTDFPFEIVIGDDCSTDGTPDIIREYSEKYPDIFKPIIRKKNLGAIANSIATLKEATGKYIALCEGDDFWTDTSKLQKQVNFLESHPDYGLCFHTSRVIFENNEQKESVWPNIVDPAKVTIDELLRENFIPTNAVMYRRQNYDKLPDNIMPFDWYLHSFHAKYGEIGYINKTMSTYRRHEGGVWWDSHADKDKLWEAQGLAHVRMFLELLKLYGEDDKKSNIINKGLNSALINLISADKRFKGQLLKTALGESPFLVEPFILSLYETIKDKEKLINLDKQEIVRLNQAVVELREQMYGLRNSLHDLTNSRVLGRIIKARDFIGAQIPRVKRIPKTVPRWVKRRFADLLPDKLRAVMRKTRQYLTRIVRKLRSDSQQRATQYVVMPNPRLEPSMPLISVVIPFYNLADTISDTLYSLESQTFRDFETIIVDDGSNDPGSIKKLVDIKKASPIKLRIIHQENQGVAAARNNGISHARGRYIICLDSDDMLDRTFIEKCTMVLETTPDISLVTTQMEVFGVVNEPFRHALYNPLTLYTDNMVITAAEFSKQAWETTGGYKSKIGYEDWEYWLNLAEHGFFGKTLPEPLFKYRTSMQSRYVEDKDVHWKNIKSIRSLHPQYKKTVKKLQAQIRNTVQLVEPADAFINMSESSQYSEMDTHRSNILITIPWMTFGGAETLIYNYCREIKDKFNLSFATGQESEHEWEYKFREITPNIYHLASLFNDPQTHMEFISNYIKTRNIDVLHAIHNGFTFTMMPELKRRHPNLKIILTLFNDRVPEYVQGAVEYQEYIDRYVSDNSAVARSLGDKLAPGAEITVIPNGIDAYNEFNSTLFDRVKERSLLGIKEKDISVFFVGRLSEEKNPDVFVRAANTLAGSSKYEHIKFFIIGDGPMRHEVEKLIKENHNENIKYLGYQSEVARYLSSADIFVLPSKIEGFPLSILEAMAMGVAVIASDVGAISEVLKSDTDGYVVKPGSSEEIVSIIKNLADSEAKLKSVKNKAHAKVEKKYSNRILGVNYRKLYEEVIE